MRSPSGYPYSMSLIASESLPADPLLALRELARSEAELHELRRSQVATARAAGATWEDIGDALGMSRQSAWEYFAKRASDRLAASAAMNTDLSEEEAMAIAVDEVKAVRGNRKRVG